MTVEPESRAGSLSGLTEPESREFHRIFMTSFIVFVVVAIIAHFLAWQWRPWLPGEQGYESSMLDGIAPMLGSIASYLV